MLDHFLHPDPPIAYYYYVTTLSMSNGLLIRLDYSDARMKRVVAVVVAVGGVEALATIHLGPLSINHKNPPAVVGNTRERGRDIKRKLYLMAT